jgi:hypothetical protein
MTFPRFFFGYVGSVLAVTLTAAGLAVAIRDRDRALEIAAWAVALCVALSAAGAFYLRWRHHRRDPDV